MSDRARAQRHPSCHPKNRRCARDQPETGSGRDEIIAGINEATLLRRAATLADVGNVASFVASDLAATLTATEVNISCGALVD